MRFLFLLFSILTCLIFSASQTHSEGVFDPLGYEALNKLKLPNSSLSDNKLQNPSFEQDALLFSTVEVGNTKTIDFEHDQDWFVIDESEAFHGKKSARLKVWDNSEHNHLIKYDEWQRDFYEGLKSQGQRPAYYNPMVASYYMQVEEGKTYTVSYYAKSEHRGLPFTVWAKSDYGDWSDQRTVFLTKNWKRYHFSFVAKKPYATIAFGQNWTAPEDTSLPKSSYYWVDALQLEEGVEVSAFDIKPIVANIEKTSRIVEVSDKKEATVRLSNFSKRSKTLDVSVVMKDFFKRPIFEKNLDVVNLRAMQSEEFLVEFEGVEQLENIGFHTIEIIINSDGYNDTEIFRYAVIDSPSVKDVKHRDIFGWGASTTSNHEKSVDLYTKLGFGLRVNNSDANMEPELVKLWQKTNSPVLYNTYGRWDEMFRTREMKTATEAEMDELVASQVESLKKFPELKYVKVVNEPEYGWKDSFMYDPEQLVPYMKKLYKALKASNPEYVVISPDLANVFQGNLDWMEAILKLGGGEAFDIMAIHTYQGTPEVPSLDTSLGKFIALADKYNFTGPLWLTEGGHYVVTHLPIMNFDANRFEGHFSSKMPLFSEDLSGYPVGVALGMRTLLTVMKHAERIPANTEWQWSNLGVETLNMMPRDHAIAYHSLAKELGNSDYEREYIFAETVKCYVFKNSDGSATAAIWDYESALSEEKREARVFRFAKSLGDLSEIKVTDIFNNMIDSDDLDLSYMPQFIKARSFDALINQLDQAYVVFDKEKAIALNVQMTTKETVRVDLFNQYHEAIDGELKISLNGEETVSPLNIGSQQRISKELSLDEGLYEGVASFELDLKVDVISDGQLFSSWSDARRVFLAKKLTSAPTIDGDLRDWNQISAYDFDDSGIIDFIGKSEGEKDLSGKLALGWDEESLYLAVWIRDDRHIQNYTDGEVWENDSVQLFFDMFNDGNASEVNLEDDYGWMIAKSSDGSSAFMGYVPSWQNAFLTPGPATDTDVAVARDDAGVTSYEIKINKANLLPLTLAENTILGFAVSVNDADEKDREQVITNTGGKEPWMTPGVYPDIILIN